MLENDTNYDWVPGMQVASMVTGETAAAGQLAQHMLKEKPQEPLIFRAIDSFLSTSINVSDSANMEDTNLLTYALFSDPALLDTVCDADVTYATPHHNERPVAFFDGAFTNPRMVLYLQDNCSAVNITGLNGPTHCAQLNLMQMATRKDLNDRLYVGARFPTHFFLPNDPPLSLPRLHFR